MRISQLSTDSGVSVASIKYYIREGLLPPGVRTERNQAVYSSHHLARLRLIRALVEIGGLSIAETREVTDAVDCPNRPLGKVLGVTQKAISAPAGRASRASRAAVQALIAAQGWQVGPDNPGIDAAGRVLDAYATLEFPGDADYLNRFACAATAAAQADLDIVASQDNLDRMAEVVAAGTILGDSLLAALRRIAQESISRERFRVPGRAATSQPGAHPPDAKLPDADRGPRP